MNRNNRNNRNASARPRTTRTSNSKPKRPRNAAFVLARRGDLYKHHKYLFLLEGRNGKWSTAGGIVEPTDKNAFRGGEREFYEETGGLRLPQIDNLQSFDIDKNHPKYWTRIYYGYTRDWHHLQDKKIHNNKETVAMKWVRIEEVKSAVYDRNPSLKLRYCVKKSLKHMFDNNLI